MNQTTHKGTGCQNHGRGLEEQTIPGFNTGYTSTLHQQPHDLALLEIKTRLGLDNLLHPCPVKISVSLRPGSSNGGPLLGIKQSKLNARRIDISGHLTTERINFAHQVTLGQAANRWITGHLRHGIQVERKKQSPATHTCHRQRSLTTRVTGANNYHIVFFTHINHTLLTRKCST
jgi:hypothetical protein